MWIFRAINILCFAKHTIRANEFESASLLTTADVISIQDDLGIRVIGLWKIDDYLHQAAWSALEISQRSTRYSKEDASMQQSQAMVFALCL